MIYIIAYFVIGIFLGSESIRKMIWGSCGPITTFILYVLIWPLIIIANKKYRGKWI